MDVRSRLTLLCVPVPIAIGRGDPVACLTRFLDRRLVLCHIGLRLLQGRRGSEEGERGSGRVEVGQSPAWESESGRHEGTLI